MRKLAATLLLIPGAWSLIAPQATLGLPQLQWMSHHVFPGETLLGALLITTAYLLIGRGRTTSTLK